MKKRQKDARSPEGDGVKQFNEQLLLAVVWLLDEWTEASIGLMGS